MNLKQLRASRKRWHHRSVAALAQRRKARRMVKRRDRQIKNAVAATTGPHAAIKWALSQVGHNPESPPGSNWGPRIGEWIKASGYAGPVPWCQCFANAAAVHGRAPQLKTGFTPTVLAGKAGMGYKRTSSPEPGDFCFFKFPGVSHDSCDHVGILIRRDAATVTCVEGNTSSGTAGSQNNGGGVYLRTRSRSIVAGYVRPPWKA